MTIDQAYLLVQYAVSKNIQQGYVSPDDFNNAINMAQGSYLDYLLGQYQKYMPGRPSSPVTFSETQRIRTSLAPLIYGTVLNIDATGLSPFPSDFEQVDSMWSLYNIYRIRFTQQDSLWSKYRSTIDPVESNPLYLLKHEGFQFYPENLAQARMSYVRTPPPMLWAYTLDGNGIPVYDPANSIQPIWETTDMMNIIVRALAIIGVNLQFGMVSQYAQEIKIQGQ